MEENRTELTSILVRLGQVETENRRLKRAGLGFLVLVGGLILMGQAKPNRTIEAERFVLNDASGRVRAKLEMTVNRPTLSLLDEKGFPVVSLVAGEDPFMMLCSRGCGQQVQLGSYSNDLFGVALYAKDKGAPLHGLQAAMGVFKGMPGFELYSEAGEQATLDLDMSGRSELVLRDRSGASTNRIDSDSILIVGRDGKSLWSAP